MDRFANLFVLIGIGLFLKLFFDAIIYVNRKRTDTSLNLSKKKISMLVVSGIAFVAIGRIILVMT